MPPAHRATAPTSGQAQTLLRSQECATTLEAIAWLTLQLAHAHHVHIHWRVGDGALARTLGGGDGSVAAVAFSEDGAQLFALVRGPDDPHRVPPIAARGWRVATGEPSLERPTDVSPGVVALAPRGPTAALQLRARTLGVWALPGEASARALATTPSAGGVGDQLSALALSPDGVLAAGGCDAGLVHLWRVADGAEIATYRLVPEPPLANGVTGVALAPDGRWLAATLRDGRLLVWPA